MITWQMSHNLQVSPEYPQLLPSGLTEHIQLETDPEEGEKQAETTQDQAIQL